MRIAKALDCPEAYFYTLDNAFADTILQLHRNRNKSDVNPYMEENIALRKRFEELEALEKKPVRAQQLLRSLAGVLAIKN